jgi:hypothetical protein
MTLKQDDIYEYQKSEQTQNYLMRNVICNDLKIAIWKKFFTCRFEDRICSILIILFC